MKSFLRKLPFFSAAKTAYHTQVCWRKMIYNRFFSTARILLYHRVAVVQEDPHLLAVTPQHFRAQLRYLKQHCTVISLTDLVNHLHQHTLPHNSVVITFDDGYADNLHEALPILNEYHVPATIFVTAGKIDDTKHFYWEDDVPAGSRGRCLTKPELRELAQHPLIEIGAHSLTHQKIAKQTAPEQKREILESKRIIEEILNQPVQGFAYPFGGANTFNSTVIGITKKAGLAYACANIHERVRYNSDTFALPRFLVRDWGEQEFAEQLAKML